MKKKLLALLTGCMLIVGTVTPVYASSFSLAGISGKNSLSKTNSGGTGKTYFAADGVNSAYRKVTVKLVYRKAGSANISSTKSASASTGPSNGYGNTTAVVTVSKPGASYSVVSVRSEHRTTYKQLVNTETIN